MNLFFAFNRVLACVVCRATGSYRTLHEFGSGCVLGYDVPVYVAVMLLLI